MNDREEEVYKSAAELRREIADLKIRLAFQEQFEEEISQILAECENPSPELLQVVSEERQGILAEIDQYYKTKAHFFRRNASFVPKIKRAAILIAAGLIISISSAMAAIQMVRTGVFEIDMRGDKIQTSIQLVQMSDIEIPPEWEGYYYPAFIPEGFEFEEVYNGTARYYDAEGKRLTFDEGSCNIGTSVDTENAKISNIEINGSDAMLIEKRGKSTVVWSVGKHYFIVEIVAEKEVALQIAESVVMIK